MLLMGCHHFYAYKWIGCRVDTNIVLFVRVWEYCPISKGFPKIDESFHQITLEILQIYYLFL